VVGLAVGTSMLVRCCIICIYVVVCGDILLGTKSGFVLCFGDMNN